MRNLLLKYSLNDAEQHSKSPLKRTAKLESLQTPNKELYNSVHPPSKEDLDLYLLILSTLVASYVAASAAEGVECNLDSLRESYEGLKRHISLMSTPSSVRNKLHLRHIGKLLRIL